MLKSKALAPPGPAHLVRQPGNQGRRLEPPVRFLEHPAHDGRGRRRDHLPHGPFLQDPRGAPRPCEPFRPPGRRFQRLSGFIKVKQTFTGLFLGRARLLGEFVANRQAPIRRLPVNAHGVVHMGRGAVPKEFRKPSPAPTIRGQVDGKGLRWVQKTAQALPHVSRGTERLQVARHNETRLAVGAFRRQPPLFQHGHRRSLTSKGAGGHEPHHAASNDHRVRPLLHAYRVLSGKTDD